MKSAAFVSPKRRDPVGFLTLFYLGCFLVLAFNLFRMQILKHDYYFGLSERNRLRVIYMEGPRGRILDRGGTPLAQNRLSFNCAVYPAEAKAALSQSARVLSEILAVSPEEIESNYRRKKPGIFNTVLLAEDLSASEAMAIEEKLDSLPGFMIQTKPQREYPLGPAAAHVIGFIGPMNEEEEEVLENYGYRSADWIGRDGIEKSYESYLRGTSGGFQIEVNSRGRMIRPLGIKEPKAGRDIQLTVDVRLQNYAQELLKHERGSVIVMELEEGGILSMNSSPSFDSNLFASSSGRKKVGRILTDDRSPMMNRGIHGRYPPGSIFKVITALAVLGSKKWTPSTSVNCLGLVSIGGTVFHCWKEAGHGLQDLTQAIAHSCNVFFYRAGMQAGIEGLVETARTLSMDERTAVDLPGEIQGVLPSKEWKKKKMHEGWFDGDTANLSIGQGRLQLTPIRMLTMIAVLATDGQLLKPHLVDKIDGKKTALKYAKNTMINRADLAAVRAGTDAVVNSESGTGRLSRPRTTRAGGKTGTAQSGQDKTHAWFVGYAPETKPKVAVVVFLEYGGRGGVAAATLAKSIFDKLGEMGYL